jgi:HEAT repeat protein
MPSKPRASLRLAGLAAALLATSPALAAPDAKPSGAIEIEMALGPGLLEPPPVRALEFADAPGPVKAPASLGTLRYARLPIGGSGGDGSGGTLAALAEPKEGPRLYYDWDGDADLANAGSGDLKAWGGFKVRRTTVQVSHAAPDPKPRTLVPLVFARAEDGTWYVVENLAMRGDLETKTGSYAVALVDGDFDGRFSEGGKDVLWFDANADGKHDAAAGERLGIPAVVKAGEATYRLTLGAGSGATVVATPAEGQAPSAPNAAPPASLLSWRLWFATATESAVEERAAAVRGAAGAKDDETWAWLGGLTTDLTPEVRTAAVESLSDKGFGADRAAEKTMEVASSSKDSKLRVKAIERLAGHPGKDVLPFLVKHAETKDKPLEERLKAVHSAGGFEEAKRALDRWMQAGDPNEVKAAAYAELAKRTPDEASLHVAGLELGSVEARASAIEALGRLGDARGIVIARKEIKDPRSAKIRAACARALVSTGKKADLEAALSVLEDMSKRSTPFGQRQGVASAPPDSEEKKALREALRKHRDREDVREWVLKKAIGHADVGVRLLAIDVMGDVEDEAVRQAFLQRIPKEDPRTARVVLVRLLAIAESLGRPDQVPALLKLADSPDDGVRDAASSAVVASGVDDPRVKEFVLRLLRAAPNRWYERVQGAETAGKGRIKEAVGDLIANVTHERRSVRFAAVEALSAIRPREAVDALIRVLESPVDGQGTRVGTAAWNALRRITGQDLMSDPDFWRSWVTSHPDFAVPAEAPVFVERKDKTVARKAFFDVPVETKRPVFVLDQSASMLLPEEIEGRFLTRWEILQDQITALLKKMEKDWRFNVVLFSQNATPFRQKSEDASPAVIKEALKWIALQQPEGETNVWSGMEVALADPDVDTIYLLTDGVPTTGEFTSATDILREIQVRNRYRRIQIHTVSVGQDSALLREIARQNNGRYVRK